MPRRGYCIAAVGLACLVFSCAASSLRNEVARVPTVCIGCESVLSRKRYMCTSSNKHCGSNGSALLRPFLLPSSSALFIIVSRLGSIPVGQPETAEAARPRPAPGPAPGPAPAAALPPSLDEDPHSRSAAALSRRSVLAATPTLPAARSRKKTASERRLAPAPAALLWREGKREERGRRTLSGR